MNAPTVTNYWRSLVSTKDDTQEVDGTLCTYMTAFARTGWGDLVSLVVKKVGCMKRVVSSESARLDRLGTLRAGQHGLNQVLEGGL